MRINKLLYLIGLVWLSSCGINTEYEAIKDIKNNVWISDTTVDFNFDIKEDAKYDVYYLVKNKTSKHSKTLMMNIISVNFKKTIFTRYFVFYKMRLWIRKF